MASNEIERNDYLELLKCALSASLYEESCWELIEVKSPRSKRRPIEYLRRQARNALVKFLSKKSYALLKTKEYDANLRTIGKDKPWFGYTMIGHRRLDNIRHCIEQIVETGIPGDLIETGAWRGGATIYMKAVLKSKGVHNRTIWVADSFQGMPVPRSVTDGWDMSKVEYLNAPVEAVKSNFDRFNLLDGNVKFLQGWFHDTLPKAPIERLALLRLDGDLYSSTMDSLLNLYHKVSDGGFVIVDDYFSWPACKEAVTDFLASNKLSPDIQIVDESAVYWQVRR